MLLICWAPKKLIKLIKLIILINFQIIYRKSVPEWCSEPPRGRILDDVDVSKKRNVDVIEDSHPSAPRTPFWRQFLFFEKLPRLFGFQTTRQNTNNRKKKQNKEHRMVFSNQENHENQEKNRKENQENQENQENKENQACKKKGKKTQNTKKNNLKT